MLANFKPNRSMVQQLQLHKYYHNAQSSTNKQHNSEIIVSFCAQLIEKHNQDEGMDESWFMGSGTANFKSIRHDAEADSDQP